MEGARPSLHATPSPGTPGEGRGEGDVERKKSLENPKKIYHRDQSLFTLEITLTPTLSRNTGRGGRARCPCHLGASDHPRKAADRGPSRPCHRDNSSPAHPGTERSGRRSGKRQAQSRRFPAIWRCLRRGERKGRLRPAGEAQPRWHIQRHRRPNDVRPGRRTHRFGRED